MDRTNAHRAERKPATLPASQVGIPAEKENAPPLPTEGIRGITEIIGKAVELTANLAAAMKSSPIQLGNVVVGNNATAPQPRQQIPDLNAHQLARIESALKRPAETPSTSKPSPESNSNPTPKPAPPASAPIPASQPTETMEPATKTELKAKKQKVLLPKRGQIKISTAADTMEPATKEILKATKKETFLEPATATPYEKSTAPQVILPTMEQIKLSTMRASAPDTDLH